MSSDDEIELAILRYLVDNPEAKDTLEGIAEWWLLREWTTRMIPAVERALEQLVAKDLILESKIGRQPKNFGLNRNRLTEIMQLVTESQRSDLEDAK